MKWEGKAVNCWHEGCNNENQCDVHGYVKKIIKIFYPGGLDPESFEE